MIFAVTEAFVDTSAVKSFVHVYAMLKKNFHLHLSTGVFSLHLQLIKMLGFSPHPCLKIFGSMVNISSFICLAHSLFRNGNISVDVGNEVLDPNKIVYPQLSEHRQCGCPASSCLIGPCSACSPILLFWI